MKHRHGSIPGQVPLNLESVTAETERGKLVEESQRLEVWERGLMLADRGGLTKLGEYPMTSGAEC